MERFGLWRHPQIPRLGSAMTVSAMGQEITQLALPTVAILSLQASPSLVGLLVALPYWAFLLLGLPAGVLIDRASRRQVLLVALAVRMAVVGTVPVAWAWGQLSVGLLLAVTVVLGITTVLSQIAERSYLPEIVEPSLLLEANAQITIGHSAAQVIGPSLGGGLIQVVGAPVAAAADVLAAGLACLCVRGMPAQSRPPVSSSLPSPSLGSAILEGVRFVAHHPVLRAILAINVIGNLGTGMVDGVVLIYLYDTLSLSPGRVGVAMALGGIGFLIAAVTTAALTARVRLGTTLALSSLVYACAPATLVLGVLGWPLMAVVLWRLLYGLTLPPYDVATATIRQSSTPDLLQGRTIAVINTFGWGALGIGPLIGGVLGQHLGVLSAILLGTAVCFIGAIPALAPALRRLPDAQHLFPSHGRS